MSSTLSPAAQSVKQHRYGNFAGMNTTIPSTALENGESQALVMMLSCYADWQGMIHLDFPRVKASAEQRNAMHVRHLSNDAFCYAFQSKTSSSLRSSLGHKMEQAFDESGAIASTVFNGKVIFSMKGGNPISYDGSSFKQVEGKNGDFAYSTTAQRRLVVAGMTSGKTEVWATRVDKEDVYPDDEKPGEVSVLRAARLDIRNLIGTGDEIKGIQSIDGTRLAIFTNDRTLIYNTDADYTKWTIDQNASIHVGTISHNSICRANGDLIFCSRSGVHTIRRSVQNGITTYSVPMSEIIKNTYLSLVSLVKDRERVSAVYDPDENQYHIYFPVTETISYRLTATIPPFYGQEASQEVKWSMSRFLNMQCGDFLNGSLLEGTPTGIYKKLPKDSQEKGFVLPEMSFTTPIFWIEDGSVIKELTSLILQAEGKGLMEMVAKDELGQEIGHIAISLDDDTTDGIFETPILRQHIRKFEHRVRGVQFEFKGIATGHIRIIAFAINVRAERKR